MKKILGLITALMIMTQAYASIAVAPTKIEINANKLKTNYVTTAVEVKGDTKVPMRFKVYPGYFKITSAGEMDMQAQSDEHDISKKIKFVPSEFNVQPGKSQKVRINIAGINSLPDGENRTVLYFEDVNPKEYSLDTGMQGIGAQLIVKTRVGVPVYLDKGKFFKKGEIESFNIKNGKDGQYTEVKVVSTGNSKLRCQARVMIFQGKKVLQEYSLPDFVVGDNNYFVSKAKVQKDNIKEKGEYTMRVVVSYTDENGKRQNIKQETQISI